MWWNTSSGGQGYSCLNMLRRSLGLALFTLVLVFAQRAHAEALQPTDTHDVVAGGTAHTCAVGVDGKVRCWGAGLKGQLGTGSFALYSTIPVIVGAIDDAIAITAGADHTCALRDDGTVWCWGDNSSGQLGDGTTLNRAFPVPVQNLDRVVAVAAGAHHTCALDDGGSVYCWGANNKHQIDGGASSLASIVLTPVLKEAGVFLALGSGPAADQTCAIIGNYAVTCWGDVGPAQTSITNMYLYEATQVVAGPEFSCVLFGRGWVKCVGANDESQLRGTASAWSNTESINTAAGSPEMIPVGVTRITAGTKHVCARNALGAVYCWGRNADGQAGTTPGSPLTQPTAVSGLTLAFGVYAGASHTCATLANGQLKCWGNNSSGQLGISTCTAPPCADQPTPTVVSPDPDVNRMGGTVLSAGYLHTCIRKADSSVWCWGYNANGQLGKGNTSDSSVPVQAAYATDQVLSISSGGFYTCVLRKGGTVQCWGANNLGQLGNGTTTASLTPATVSGVTNAIAVEAGDNTACALQADGALKCWGNNDNLQAGGPSGTASVLTPVTIALQPGFSALAVGRSHTCATTMGASAAGQVGGQTFCWGMNTHGECGASSGSPIAVPNPAGSGDATQLSAHGWTTCERNSTIGEVLCWGDDSMGQMGDDTTRSVTIRPTFGVGSSTRYIALGLQHFCFDGYWGSVYCTGRNSEGELGNGTFAQSLNFVQTSTLVFPRALTAGAFHSCALGSRGQVTCWGDNSKGQLGDGTLIQRPSPVSAVTFPCNVGASFWNDSNPCTRDRCTVTAPPNSTMAVSYSAIVGEPCTDDLLCDGTNDKCDSNGHCVPDPTFSVNDGNACTSDACDETRGVTHTAISIDDGNPCTLDACNSVTGVSHTITTGQACSDACGISATCTSTGACGTGTLVPDGNPCTDDICDATTGTPYPKTAAGTTCGSGRVCDGAGRCDVPVGPLPPDPSGTSPAFTPDEQASFVDRTQFLYNPMPPYQAIQTPTTQAIVLDPARVGVIRGKVTSATSANPPALLPLPGVAVTIKDHPEFGSTLTRADGMFDLAANGGGDLVVEFKRSGYLSAQRHVSVPWNDYTVIDDVVLVKSDSQATAVPICPSCTGQAMRIVQSTPVTDGDGTRAVTMLFPSDVTAHYTSGTQSFSPSTITVRATEFSNSLAGGANAMPGELPATSGYTFAAEFSVDEAEAAGATRVDFSSPVPVYVDNFLALSPGKTVPVGYYDRTQARWVPSESGNGTVVKIVSISNGLAVLDTIDDGNDNGTDNGVAIGITLAERAALATKFVPGQSFWRVPVTHFTPYDLNWPFGFPTCANGGPCPSDTAASLRATTDTGCPVRRQGSIIECENQVLGEKLDVAGTPYSLDYSSARVPGALGQRTIRIALPSPYHSQRIGFVVRVSVANQRYVTFISDGPTINREYEWSWTDTKDAYGQPLSGIYTAYVEVGELYPALYKTGIVFGNTAPNGGQVLTDRQRMIYEIDYSFKTTLHANNPKTQPVAGWSIDAHHAYNLHDHILERGDGSEREFKDTEVDLLAGNGTPTSCYPLINGACTGEGSLATTFGVPLPGGIAVAANGDTFISEADAPPISPPNYGHIVLRVARDGTVHRFAGIPQADGTSGPDSCRIVDGPALSHCFTNPRGLAVRSDGAVYVADSVDNGQIWRIDTDGTVRRVAGLGTTLGDGGPALAARLSYPTDLALAPDGSLYVADTGNNRIRKIGTDGVITTFAGNGGATVPPGELDGIPAVAATLPAPQSVAIRLDGSVFCTYQAASGDARVRRITPDGVAWVFAGGGSKIAGFNAQGAKDAGFGSLTAVKVDSAGVVYTANDVGIYSIDATGAITVVAGVRQGADVIAGYAVPLPAPRTSVRPSLQALAAAPDHTLVVGESVNRVRRIITSIPGPGAACGFQCAAVVPEVGGNQAYCFDGDGRHVCTFNGTTGATLLSFGYDPSTKKLTSITDADSNVTQIAYDGSGNPSRITAPFGQPTTLAVDANGYLSRVTDPLNGVTVLESSNAGLLQALTDPRIHRHGFQYDAQGRLQVDYDPVGGSQTLARQYTDTGRTVTITTALGRTTTYDMSTSTTGDSVRTVTDPAGLKTVLDQNSATFQDTTLPDGTATELMYAFDPQWGAARMAIASSRMRLPSLGSSSGWSLTTDHATPALSFNTDGTIASRMDTWTTTGASGSARPATTVTYDGVARKYTVTSPAGRQVITTVDAQGRPVRIEAGANAGIDPIILNYNRGRLATLTQGARTRTLTYSTTADLTQGYLTSTATTATTDPRTYSTAFLPDAWGKVLRSTTNNVVTQLSWDPAGNLSTVTPPGKPVHVLAYDGLDRLRKYTAPVAPSAYTQETTYQYDADGALTSQTFPDGRTIQYVYDTNPATNTGRLQSVVLPDGTINVVYDGGSCTGSGCKGQITALNGPNGINLGYTYDGPLTKSEAWTNAADGSLVGRLDWTFDDLLRPQSENLTAPAGVYPSSFDYDADGLTTCASAAAPPCSPTGAVGEQIQYDPNNGLLKTTSIGTASDQRTYNTLGEIASYTASAGGIPYLSEVYDDLGEYQRDGLGRVRRITRSQGGASHYYDYTYDLLGRLTDVAKDGQAPSHYSYDDNGNRLGYTASGGSAVLGSYDAQDRLTSYGSYTYTYNPDGSLATKTSGTQKTVYTYDARGALESVSLPDGRQVTYINDALGRRISKKIGASVVATYIYSGPRIIAELGANGAVTSRFIYGSRPNVPDFVVRTDGTYKIFSDQLGSPRVAVSTGSSNTTLVNIDYDEFGNVAGTSVGLGAIPFGFAGGLYDVDTGLVRFGARDYDPVTGRWTGKDPVLWRGKQTNLYQYTGDDSVNFTDPTGLWSMGFTGGASAEGGMGGLGSAGAQVSVLLGKVGYLGHGFLSGGIFSTGTGASPCHPGSKWALGAYAGAGGGMWWSNTDSASEIRGYFDNFSLNTPWFGLNVGVSGGTYVIAVTSGPGWGADISWYGTNTISFIN